MGIKTFEKFTWTIKNFSKLDSEEVYSEFFFVDGHAWRILMFPKGDDVDCLSIYLQAGGLDLDNLPNSWSISTHFKLALINKVKGKKTKVKGIKQSECTFNATESTWGYPEFISLDKLCDPNSGFSVNDTCVIVAAISIIKSEHFGQVDYASSKIDISLDSAEDIEHTNPLPNEISTTSFGELVDFRGLGKIEKGFVPLLEEVCSWHPSLVECQRKRSRTHRLTEWAFTALGRVLHFLKTNKVKDMNGDGCNHLQILWEELETFGFDLCWLEPHFQYALDMKSCVERYVQVKKMKENVAALEMDLEIARQDLVKAEKDFDERHLDAKLGYGGD
ncbi:TRAF-like [Sesbania bispinosa]|nr:TRAF-like [Sesbania bispinosa]